MFKKLSNIDTDFWHLIFRAITFGLLTFCILYFVTPIAFLAIYGEGASSTQIENLPITKVCWAFSAVIILLPVIGQRFIANYKKGQLSKAKDYLFIALFVIILSGLIACYQTN